MLDKLNIALRKVSESLAAVKKMGARIRYWRVLLVFILALLVRLIYVNFFLQQRICNFGDASLYLLTGHQLSELVITSHGIADFFVRLTQHATVVPGSFQSFTATGLTDRLLMDGPVYPTYLALMQLIIGIGSGKPAFDGFCLQIATFNAVVDALHCILIYYVGRLAFGKKIGLLAGLLFAIYPPAILTTQQCYSEPFAGLILTLWIGFGVLALQRHSKSPYRFIVPLSFGALTGILIQTRPAFLLLPAVVIACAAFAAILIKKLGVIRVAVPITSTQPQSIATSEPGIKTEAPPVTNISFSTSYTKPVGDMKPPSVIAYGAQPIDKPTDSDQTSADTGEEASESTKESVEVAQEPSEKTSQKQPTEASEALEGTEETREESKSEISSETFDASPEPVAPAEPSAQAEPSEAASTATQPSSQNTPEKKTEPAPPAKPPISKSNQQKLACILIGFLSVIGIWGAYTHMVTGKVQFVINRAPAYNLFIGNQVSSDGWKTNPIVEGIPDSVGSAAGSIGQGLLRHPVKFVSMEIRKLTRLWLGGWNDFQFDLFGISRQKQAIWQGLMLWCGFVGAAMVLCRRQSKREFIRAAILVAVIAFHCIYCLFEPVSRYSLTAMPSILILAAVSINSVWSIRPIHPFRLFLFVVAAALFFNLQTSYVSNLATLMNMAPADWLGFARFVDALIFALGWIVLGAWTSIYCKNEFRVVRLGALVCALMTCVHMLGDPEWREWFVEMRTIRQVVTQEIFIPALESQPQPSWKHVFVLVDIESPSSVPPMAVMVNGVPIADPLLTWFQVCRRRDVLEGFAMQGSAMGKDPRSFRQWWAFPVPVENIKFADNNRIQLAITADDVPVGHRLYGDYERPNSSAQGSGESQTLPSFNTVSFTKGFATFGTGESRIYQVEQLGGRTMRTSLAVGKDSTTSDLSLEHGRQIGCYRVRVAVPYRKAATQESNPPTDEVLPSTQQAQYNPLFDANRMLVLAREERRVSGSDPNTYFLGKQAASVPAGLKPGTRIYLSGELMHPKTPSACSVTIRLQGVDKEGNQREWTPLVTPTRISVGAQWRKHILCDIVPEEALGWSNLTASVLVSPFPSDKFFLHRQRALRDLVFTRNFSLMLLDAIDLPPPQECEWRFF